ncbi:DUF2339 domain-containing protein [Pollutibacter soli]|uniref:DUF2339 domain-containing protein n=1 Tax=Pollutibacter soli TaxID=3034157 RepID=UPI003013D3B2
MTEHQNYVNDLTSRLTSITDHQRKIAKEILLVKIDLENLKQKTANAEKANEAYDHEEKVVSEQPVTLPVVTNVVNFKEIKEGASVLSEVFEEVKVSPGLEKFIGENLAGKIGILITIIGVGIGTKYSIDHNLVSPLVRIIFGYLLGAGMLITGFRLRERYENYSALLVSGSMATMYLVTYAAYNMFDLLPRPAAFLLMVLFTVFTVIAALRYNRQIIAHIGMVCAYAIPFLLSDGSGKVEILFTYTAIINLGILVVAFHKSWKGLYLLACCVTWLIFSAWFTTRYEQNIDFGLALIFLSINFLTFYITLLAYALKQKEPTNALDILLLFMNSFILFGIGFEIVNGYASTNHLKGLFAVANALIHLIAAHFTFHHKKSDNLYYLFAGLGIGFLILAVPVQLDGFWVTILWSAQAAIMFFLAKKKHSTFYEYISCFLLGLGFLSLVQDWQQIYNFLGVGQVDQTMKIFLNQGFLTSVFYTITCLWTIKASRKSDASAEKLNASFLPVVRSVLPVMVVLVCYISVLLEISAFWQRLYSGSAITIANGELKDIFYNKNIPDFKVLTEIIYTLVFLTALSFLNNYRWKSKNVAWFNIFSILTAVFVFLVTGLYLLGDLRDRYIHPDLNRYFSNTLLNFWVRYLTYPFVALALYSIYQIRSKVLTQVESKAAGDILFHLTFLWIISSELISMLDLLHSDQTYKLGLSILWGAYAVMLVVLGIKRSKVYLRISAFFLFGFTLCKLFFYDLAQMGSISKTILFISLGVLLLLISYLYNRFRSKIGDEVVV